MISQLDQGKLYRVARHILIIRAESIISAPEKGRPTLVHKLHDARLKEALVMAMLTGIQATDFAVLMDVIRAAEIAGPNWRGRLGATVDDEWLKTATEFLVNLWSGFVE